MILFTSICYISLFICSFLVSNIFLFVLVQAFRQGEHWGYSQFMLDYFICRHCQAPRVHNAECECLVWTHELFFLFVETQHTFCTWQNCFWTTATLIKSMTWIKLHETAADWQVFANTTTRFHLLQPRHNLAEYFISANMFLCHTFEVVVSDFTGVKFLAYCFFFYCFASPFFHHNNVNLPCIAHQKQPCLPAAEHKPSLSEPGCCHTFKLFIRILIDRNMII